MRAGECLVGAWLSFSDPAAAEIMAGTGYDWILIDTEHAPFSLESLQTVLMAFNGRDTVPIVRVPWNDTVRIKQVLDLGAEGVLVPMVSTPDEARAAVAACKYPPQGIRGFGPRRASDYYRDVSSYIAGANDGVIVAIQIERQEAVEILDSILSVPEIDLVCLGPMDLSGSLGVLGQFDHPDVAAAIDRVIKACAEKNLPLCLGTALGPEKMLEFASRGVRFILAAEDHVVLREGTDDLLGKIRRGTADRAL